MPVQPMKSIAAVALSDSSITASQLSASGVLAGVLMFFLSVTGLVDLVNALVPQQVVSGLQLGIGLKLGMLGVKNVMALPFWFFEGGGTIRVDCQILAIVCGLTALVLLKAQDGERKSERDEGKKDKENNKEDKKGKKADAQDNGLEKPQMLFLTTSSAESEKSVPPCESCNSGDSRPVFSPLSPQNAFSNVVLTIKRTNPPPAALTLFLIGVSLAAVELCTTDNADNRYSLPLPVPFSRNPLPILFSWKLGSLTSADWKIGLWDLAVPQIPLTTLNSVVSVCALAAVLYPDRGGKGLTHDCEQGGEGGCYKHETFGELNSTGSASETHARAFSSLELDREEKDDGKGKPSSKQDQVVSSHAPSEPPVSRKQVGVSVGLMNLLFCPLGAMPSCHGAGGLSAQHKFGARTGTSVILLGLFKALLAVSFGEGALTLLDAVPDGVLGVLLCVSGVELASTGLAVAAESLNEAESGSNTTTNITTDTTPSHKNQMKKKMSQCFFIVGSTAACILGSGETHYGVLSGLVVYHLYGEGVSDYRKLWRGRGKGGWSQ